MLENNTICKKINEIFPELSCGDEIKVRHASNENFWVVNLRENGRELETFVDDKDVQSCLEKGVCIGLGLDVSLLKDNVGKTV